MGLQEHKTEGEASSSLRSALALSVSQPSPNDLAAGVEQRVTAQDAANPPVAPLEVIQAPKLWCKYLVSNRVFPCPLMGSFSSFYFSLNPIAVNRISGSGTCDLRSAEESCESLGTPEWGRSRGLPREGETYVQGVSDCTRAWAGGKGQWLRVFSVHLQYPCLLFHEPMRWAGMMCAPSCRFQNAWVVPNAGCPSTRYLRPL